MVENDHLVLAFGRAHAAPHLLQILRERQRGTGQLDELHLGEVDTFGEQADVRHFQVLCQSRLQLLVKLPAIGYYFPYVCQKFSYGAFCSGLTRFSG